MRLGSRLRLSVLVIVTGFLVAGPDGRAGAQLGPINAPDLVGAWTLVSIEERRPDGATDSGRGPNPRGLIIYDRSGHMSVHIVRDPPDGYYGYFGTYHVDEAGAVVTHHIQGSVNPAEVGRDYRRRLRLVDDRLVLTVSDTTRLTWRRLRSRP